ncbi:MAG TPA: hypothetical protein VM100_00430 [Longimicrobiales bacterium]|nr:hypothetical protein [Longimicrobiales bacterium]
MNSVLTSALMQAVDTTALTGTSEGWDNIVHWVNSTGYFKWYLLVMFLLWLIARLGQKPRKDFSAEAQNVLNEKFEKGEIDKKTYEKYRQELSMRVKKD